MNKRAQEPRHITRTVEKGNKKVIMGTEVEMVPGYCNNFQLWDTCAVHSLNAAQCPFRRACSICDQTDHGAINCPKRHY
jgi:hypothetical protein